MKAVREKGGVKESFSLDVVHERDLQDAVSWDLVNLLCREIDRLYAVAKDDPEQINREHARSALNEIVKRVYENSRAT